MLQSSGVYWQGNSSGQLLQRVYGICFPEKKMLFDWEEFIYESAKRDHRVIGKVRLFVYNYDYVFIYIFFPESRIVHV